MFLVGLHKVGGNQRGGKIALAPEITKMLAHQVKLGNLKDGETAYVKFAGDGFNYARRTLGTAHTVTISNSERALQIGTISIVSAGENYHVRVKLSNQLKPVIVEGGGSDAENI